MHLSVGIVSGYVCVYVSIVTGGLQWRMRKDTVRKNSKSEQLWVNGIWLYAKILPYRNVTILTLQCQHDCF